MSKYLYSNISFILINAILFSFISAIILLNNGKTIFLEWRIGGSSLNFRITLLFDFISCLFIRVVFCISSNVVWYRKRYISEDKDANRFILLVFGFVISIILLILRPNIIRILLGWDGLGLISYALVVYYPTKKSRSAGMLTVLRNRVGDVCVLLSIAWFTLIGDFNFFIWNLTDELSTNFWLPLLVISAALTKRAQIPFSAWLPAAMAAPTPVSALVHSSTLVTAGVYLLIRFSYLLEFNWSLTLLFISTITMFMSGIVAVFESDLKKIIALSTLSQLGVIMFSISLGLYLVAFFHLATHALFKALLFLCAGALIHGVGGSQDVRHFGGLAKNFPLVASCLNLANLSLCGIPFISGFYSKDLIVELACQNSWNLFIIIIIFVSLGLTVAYSIRLTFRGFINFSGNSSNSSLCDIDYTLVSPILILTTISLFSGPTLAWTLFPFPCLILLPSILKIGALIIITLASLSMISILSFSLNIENSLNKFIMFNGKIWFLPFLSGQRITLYSIKRGEQILKILDQGWLEFVSYQMSSTKPYKFNYIINLFQNNSLKVHFLVFLLWSLLAVIYLLC